ncbi:MAG: hypothetical protein COA67_02135 [Lutibacter sp.]|nr:MAG: hypothetical protein COA67_02135 [Lutibacter sp.]
MQKRITLILVCLIINISYSQPTEKVAYKDTVQQLVPTDILFKKAQNSNYSISPNGKYFAEVVTTFSDNDIHIIDIDEYKIFKTIPLKGKSVQNLLWLTDNRLLYESLGKINAIDIDGTNASTLVSSFADIRIKGFYSFIKSFRYNSIISLLPENKKEILIETFDTEGFASIKRVNVFTGQKIIVVSGKKHKINKWITDLNGTPQLGIVADENIIKYLKYNNKENKFEQFNIKVDGVDYPFIIKPNSYLEQNLSYEGFGFNPNVIYMSSNINSDKRKLIAYNILEEKIEKTVLEDVNCDINDPHGKGIQLIFNSSTKDIFGVKYDNLIPKFKWYSIEFDGFQNKLNETFPSFINDIIDYDDKGERFVIHQWNDNESGNIGIYDTTDDTYDIMFYFNKELNEYRLSKTKVIIAKTRDEFKLPCYLNLPIDFKNDYSFPMVVIPHGGPWSRDYFEFDKYSQYFASRGYAVLRVNFRGSTGFGKKHVLSGVNSIDEIMINDIADAVNFIAEKYKVDKRKLFIFGHSYGGYATYMSLIKYPNLYASGVALSAPTDIKKWMKTKKKEKDYFTYRFWEKVLGTRKSKYLDQISPINFIDSIKKPLLIFHGKRDKTISVNQAEEMISELQNNGKDAKLEILQNEGHTFYDSNGLGYILDSADEFFKEAMNKID